MTNEQKETLKPVKCPLIEMPLEECYCKETQSQYTEEIIYFCGGHFEQCVIYQSKISS